MVNTKIYFQKSDILGQKNWCQLKKWHINDNLCIILNTITVY